MVFALAAAAGSLPFGEIKINGVIHLCLDREEIHGIAGIELAAMEHMKCCRRTEHPGDT